MVSVRTYNQAIAYVKKWKATHMTLIDLMARNVLI